MLWTSVQALRWLGITLPGQRAKGHRNSWEMCLEGDGRRRSPHAVIELFIDDNCVPFRASNKTPEPNASRSKSLIIVFLRSCPGARFFDIGLKIGGGMGFVKRS
jgi:hypothetical protein